MRDLRSARFGRRGPSHLLAFAFAFALVAALSAGAAAAAPSGIKLVEGDVALEYRRENGTALCPDEAALRQRAADGFDLRDPFVPPGAPASARLRIVLLREGKRYRGALAVLDPEGREVASTTEEHHDCDALVWVLAHRVTIAILHRPRPTPACPSPAPGSPEPPSPVRACDARCIDALNRRVLAGRVDSPAIRPAVAFGGLASLALTPSPGPGAWLGVAFQWQRAVLWTELRGSGRTVAASYSPDRAATLGWMSALLAPCARWKVLVGCAFVEGGVYEYSFPTPNPPTLLSLFALGPRVGLDVPVGAGFFLRAFADLVLRPLVPRFSIRVDSSDDSPVLTWQAPPVSALLTVGIGWSS